MADCVVQVDLSEQAVDFRRLALQPGMALIDRSGAHLAILRKWLGTNMAEPTWDGNFAKYQIRGEEGVAIDPKSFQPLTAAECRGAFRGEIEALAQKLEAAPARTGTERARKARHAGSLKETASGSQLRRPIRRLGEISRFVRRMAIGLALGLRTQNLRTRNRRHLQKSELPDAGRHHR